MAHSYHDLIDADEDRRWVKKARERYVRQRKREMIARDELIDFDGLQVQSHGRTKIHIVSG